MAHRRTSFFFFIDSRPMSLFARRWYAQQGDETLAAGWHWRPASVFLDAGLQIVLPVYRLSGARTDPAVGAASYKLVAGEAMECDRRSIGW